MSAGRILFVEDNEEVAYLMRAMLEQDGYVIDHSPDGRAAVSYIETNDPPDLVILDVMLPYLDGFQLIQKIRDHEPWKGVPILMLSGRSREPDVVRALKLGADDYVIKPFRPIELTVRVQKLIGVRE